MILSDNQGALNIVEDPTNYQRAKHIDIRCHFVQHALQYSQISIDYIPSSENPADVLTKHSNSQNTSTVSNSWSYAESQGVQYLAESLSLSHHCLVIPLSCRVHRIKFSHSFENHFIFVYSLNHASSSCIHSPMWSEAKSHRQQSRSYPHWHTFYNGNQSKAVPKAKKKEKSIRSVGISMYCWNILWVIHWVISMV